MSDLISRQAAIDAIWTHATNILENSDYDLFFQDVYKMTHRHVVELIQNLPSAEPVKHGRWIDIEPAPWGQVYETCSECGIRQAPDNGKDKFCSVCGARMDKEKDND